MAVLMTLWVPDVVVGPLRVENFQLIGLTPTFAHLLCAHIVPLVLGCRGHGSVLLPLWLHFQPRIEMESLQLCGINSTVSSCITALVSGMYML